MTRQDARALVWTLSIPALAWLITIDYTGIHSGNIFISATAIAFILAILPLRLALSQTLGYRTSEQRSMKTDLPPLIILASTFSLLSMNSHPNILFFALASCLLLCGQGFAGLWLWTTTKPERWRVTLSLMALLLGLVGAQANIYDFGQTHVVSLLLVQGILLFAVTASSTYDLMSTKKVGAGMTGVMIAVSLFLLNTIALVFLTSNSLTWPLALLVLQIPLMAIAAALGIVLRKGEIEFAKNQPVRQREESTGEFKLVPVDREWPASGFRAWTVVEIDPLGEDPKLGVGAINSPTKFWTSSTHFATCKTNFTHHDAPQEKCSCGLYALNSLAKIPSWAGHLQPCSHCVVGAVIGYGIVCQHETAGWRSEYQRVVGILDRSINEDEDVRGREVATLLDVPFLQNQALTQLLHEFGESLA